MKLKNLCIIIFSIILSLVLCSCIDEKNSENDSSNEKVYNIYDFIDILENNGINSIYDNIDGFKKSLKNCSEKDIVNILYNEKYSVSTKHVIVELSENINNGLGIVERDLFEKTLLDKTIDNSIRIAILNELEFDNDNNEVLEKLILEENSTITTNALRTLERVNPRKALLIANKIIENIKQFGDYQIKVSVMVKSDYLKDMNKVQKYISDIELNKYIDLCIGLFEISDDSVFRDSVIFSLMDICDIRSVRAIIYHEGIDEILKKSCVSKNYLAFEKSLNSNFSDSDIECIVKALEIEPIIEIAELLEKKIATIERYKTSQVNKVLYNAKKGGYSIDISDIDREPKYKWE